MPHWVEPTLDNIHQGLQQANRNVEADPEGHLVVRGNEMNALLLIEQEGILKVRFLFHSTQKTESMELLRAINEFNTTYVIVKAFWLDGLMMFDTDICISGGISIQSLLQTLSSMETILKNATEIHSFLG